MLRRLARESDNPKVRVEAFRNLAADSSSLEMLEEAMVDANEDPEVRHISAMAVQKFAPDSFAEKARSLVKQPDADEGLKVRIFNTMMHAQGADRKAVGEALKSLLESLEQEDSIQGAQKLMRMIEDSQNDR